MLPPRPCQTAHISARERIVVDRGEHDRDGDTGRRDGLQRGLGAEGDQQVGLAADEFRGGHKRTARLVDRLIDAGEILSLDESIVAQLRQERLIVGNGWRRHQSGTEKPDAEGLSGRCLRGSRTRRPQRRRRAADERDEPAPFHSITSSARASRVAGMARLSALAVCKLMTNSNLADCSTGRPFSPLRMRPT